MMEKEILFGKSIVGDNLSTMITSWQILEISKERTRPIPLLPPMIKALFFIL